MFKLLRRAWKYVKELYAHPQVVIVAPPPRNVPARVRADKMRDVLQCAEYIVLVAEYKPRTHTYAIERGAITALADALTALQQKGKTHA